MTKPILMALCVLSLPARSLYAQPETWFGDFIMTAPDGNTSHDTAVLILDQRGSALTGSIGRTVDQQTPYRDGKIDGDRISFHLDAAGGLDFVLTRNAATMTGVATGDRVKATLNLKPAPGLLPKPLLVEEITRADRELFDAFAACDVARYAAFLAEGIRLRRELDRDSLIVDAAPGFGAIEAGIHRFYSRNPRWLRTLGRNRAIHQYLEQTDRPLGIGPLHQL